jgi:DNA repair protein RAD51/DNA repair protein RadA
MVVVDSFTSRFRLATKFDGRSQLGERNQEFSRHLAELEQMAKDLGCPVLLNCQVYANPTQYGGSTVIYGSSLMMHMVNFVVMMKSKQGQLAQIDVQNHPEHGDFDILAQITDDGLRNAE